MTINFRHKKLLFLIAIVALIYACKKDISISNFDPKNTIPKSLQYFELEKPFGFLATTPLIDNRFSKEGVLLGRMLFYDPILSADSTQSCSSCHLQKNAFTDPRQFSIGITGALGLRNGMPLFNLNWHNKGFFWDGRASNLRSQVLIPIEDPIEMNNTIANALTKLNSSSQYTAMFNQVFGAKNITADHLAKALEQFLNTLISSNSKFDKKIRFEAAFDDQEADGEAFFHAENIPALSLRGADCAHCHASSGSLFTNHDFSNNGLDTGEFSDLGRFKATGLNSDKGKFKVPSLRNLSYTAPYMHDGRFTTIDQVLDFYSDHVKLNSPNLDPAMSHSRTTFQFKFTQSEKDMLKAFLKTLDDPIFIADTAKSSPFK